MDIGKALLIKFWRELLITTACLSHNNKRKPEVSKRKRSEWVLSYRTLKVLLKATTYNQISKNKIHFLH